VSVNRHYTIDEAAEILGVPRTWVRDKVTNRKIPHTRIGKHVRFTDEHLQAISDAGYQPPRVARGRIRSVA
jgi:excisionase family DNA binding protein